MKILIQKLVWNSCSRIFARPLFTSPAIQAKSNRSCPTCGPCYSVGRPTWKLNSPLWRNPCRPFSMLPACSIVCCQRAKNASTKPCLKLFIFCWVSRKPTSRTLFNACLWQTCLRVRTVSCRPTGTSRMLLPCPLQYCPTQTFFFCLQILRNLLPLRGLLPLFTRCRWCPKPWSTNSAVRPCNCGRCTSMWPACSAAAAKTSLPAHPWRPSQTPIRSKQRTCKWSLCPMPGPFPFWPVRACPIRSGPCLTCGACCLMGALPGVMASLRSRLFFRLFPPPRAPCRFLRKRAHTILLHLRNHAGAPIHDFNVDAVRRNPDAAAGLSGSVELPAETGAAPCFAPDAASSSAGSAPSDFEDFAMDDADSPTFCSPEASVADALAPQLAWVEVVDACVLHTANPDTYASHFRAHAAFQMFLPASFAAAASPAPAALHASMLPELLAAEKDWAALVAALEPCSPPDVDVSALPLSGAAVAAPTPLDTVAQWLTAGRCNQADGALNIKQVAMLVLRACWLQDLHIHALSGLSTAPPRNCPFSLAAQARANRTSCVCFKLWMSSIFRAPLVRALWCIPLLAWYRAARSTAPCASPLSRSAPKIKALARKRNNCWPTGPLYGPCSSMKFRRPRPKLSAPPNSAPAKSRIAPSPGAASKFIFPAT